MLARNRVLCAMTCLAILGGCLPFGPNEDDMARFITVIRSESGAGEGTVEITDYRCRRMEHGQSTECKVEFKIAGGEAANSDQTSPQRLYLIVRKLKGNWTLYEHRDKP